MALTLAPERHAPPALVAAPAAVELRGVSHTYRARAGQSPALDGVDLLVAEGELLALVGPSGCGKSTLLRLVAGLLEPSAGSVSLHDTPPRTARQRLGVGWMAQDDGLLPWRTVADNVALPMRLHGRRDAARVSELLHAVGLADSARRYPHELSGGMRQRAALARALVGAPAFLLLDEPFAHLDEMTRERLGLLLLDTRAAAVAPPTTLLVTHSVAEAVRLADRVVVLSPRPGRILADMRVTLSQPRRDDDPAFGRLVRAIKEIL